MIIDLHRFVLEERPYWAELERILEVLDRDAAYHIDLAKAQRLYYLYQRTSADLAKLMTFAAEPQLRGYLESLMARAYGELHETRDKVHRFSPWDWFFRVFPQAFRRRWRAFAVSVAVTLVGLTFGGLALALDPEAKEVILPFSHLMMNPSQRVQEEEQAEHERRHDRHIAGSAFYMTHNTRVSITTMALGLTWGVGTMVSLFYNGALLGAVVVDYILAGETKFVVGWLLPHGAVEIPAIVLAGQAGLVLAGALVGWGSRAGLRTRLRAIVGDLATLIFGVALLLVWAGIIESFLSQYHEPVLPYSAKITFGVIELILLTYYLSRSGREDGRASTLGRGHA